MRNFNINSTWFIVLLIVSAAWLPQYLYSFSATTAQRQACERGNVQRQSELEQRQALVRVNIGRVKASPPGPERQANVYALQAYRENKKDLIDAQKDVAVELGSVIVDCNSIYKNPFPFNL